MPPSRALPRSAVVDLGSNSVRLVVFEGQGRNPVAIFNEKAVLRLGRGLTATGRLNDDSIDQARTVMNRYHAIARAMGADPFVVLATAAVREATNGQAFVADIESRMPGVKVQILSGEQEASYAALGLACGIPDADGIIADIGGGSLELGVITHGKLQRAETLRLGVIRLSERAGGNPARARELADSEIGGLPWLEAKAGGTLYLVGGAFRALARIEMHRTDYPLAIVHHYQITAAQAADLAMSVAVGPRRLLERIPGLSRRRIDDLPYAAIALRRLITATQARRVVFSANGLREGWYMQNLPPAVRAKDTLIAAGEELSAELARDPALPASLLRWTDPLFPDESPREQRLRHAACLVSDIGVHEHPDYRAEQVFLRLSRQAGIGLNHPERLFLGFALAIRYEADPEAPFLQPLRPLLDMDLLLRAEQLGHALRLAYTLSGATPALLADAKLQRSPSHLTLSLTSGSGVFAGEAVQRRLDRLAESLGLQAILK